MRGLNAPSVHARISGSQAIDGGTLERRLGEPRQPR